MKKQEAGLLMKWAKKLFVLWAMIMFLATFASSLTYLIAQQMLRLGANELPLQAAIQTANFLSKGQSAEDALGVKSTDISQSLETFVLIYDSDKKLVATSALLDSHDPSYPLGVLDHLNASADSRVTWQPKTGLRFASVAIKANGYYVVGARSLSETERLISNIGRLVLLAWFACLLGVSVCLALIYYVFRTRV